MHHSEERYLELLDSFNGVTETYPLTSLTVSLDVTGHFHLVLLDRITWRYWTVSPGVTKPHHLMLLDSFTWRYWTVSPDVTGQFHLSLLIILNDKARSADRYLANNWQIKRAKCNVKLLHHGLHHSPFITFLNFRECWLIFKYRIL